jgi:hypothetical protein
MKHKCIGNLMVLILVVALAGQANAATRTWDNDAGDNDWYESTNWDPDGSPLSSDQVDFTFYNESSIDFSIARIYFDDNLLLDVTGITEGLGTSFSQPATIGNLPGGNLLEPPFVTTEEFSFKGAPASPQNGVNPGEWVQIAFDLKDNCIFKDVIDKLNTNTMRLGTHVIALCPTAQANRPLLSPSR